MTHTQAIQEFAKSVGMRVKSRRYEGVQEFILICPLSGNELCIEYDFHDMVDSIRAYAGSHPEFATAETRFLEAVQ